MATKKMLRDLARMMERHYVEKGYMYSGSAHPGGIALSLGISEDEALADLLPAALAAGLIVVRNCQALSYELPAEARRALVEKHGLRVAWERDHHAFYPNDPTFGEIGRLFAGR